MLPAGSVTFLFTDIEGSTSLWDLFPAEMRAALSIHDRIMSEAVGAAGGHVIKHTGDGVFAVFASPPAALAAAIQAQVGFGAHEWDPVIGSLAVRMALHTDEADPVDGDYHGIGVNRVARIEAAGHGGQILLSEATFRALAAGLPPGVSAIDLGRHSLRGLSRPEVIYQVVVPGLRASFPPLRTASVARGYLPVFPTSFVGRVDDLDRIVELLADPGCRILTILGPGGIGKTRLSVEVARRAAAEQGAVAHFVSLAGVATPESIIRELAASLNFTIDLSAAGNVDETTQVLDLLRDQRMILILDNFEHLVAAASLVGRLAMTAPHVTVLVTSRERLALTGEWIYEVSGLAVEMADGPLSDAGRLFVARARQAGAPPRDQVEGDVEALCRMLGGMPLAIELAAAWAGLLPVAEIALEVRGNLDFLSAARRDVPERHQSVRAAFDHSWRRLSESLKDAFGRLSVFSAPFTREAAAAVAGAGLPDLVALIDRSLVRRAGLGRFDLHPLLREFGLEALGDRAADGFEAHGRYYLDRLLRREAALRGSIDQIEVRDEVVDELGNLRAATMWAIDRLPGDEMGAIVRALNPFYFLYSWAEAVDHFGAIAGAIESRQGSAPVLDDDAFLWAKTLQMVNLVNFGEIDRVTAELTRVRPAWERRGGLGLAACLLGLGIAAEQRGDLEAARRELELARDAGFESDRLLQLEHGAWYGWTVLEQGEVELASSIFRESVAMAEAEETYPGRAYLLSKLGVATDALGHHEEAARYHQESREIFVKTGDLGGQAYTLSRLSWTYWLMGDFDRAKRYGREGLEKFEEVNHRWGITASLCRIGLAELGLGEVGAARVSFETALHQSIANGMKLLGWYALMGLGQVLAAEGRTEEAIRLLGYVVGRPQNPYADLAQQALTELAVAGEGREAGAEMTFEEAMSLATGPAANA
jgi:class 3 adenylate cyclase/tetratricopeptide (TPR) repeat protein